MQVERINGKDKRPIMPKWEVIEWKDNKAFQSYIEAPTESDANVLMKTQGIKGTVTGFILVYECEITDEEVNRIIDNIASLN
jgi:hypothetical protein